MEVQLQPEGGDLPDRLTIACENAQRASSSCYNHHFNLCNTDLHLQDWTVQMISPLLLGHQAWMSACNQQLLHAAAAF